jgi:hypothetical protein
LLRVLRVTSVVLAVRRAVELLVEADWEVVWDRVREAPEAMELLAVGQQVALVGNKQAAAWPEGAVVMEMVWEWEMAQAVEAVQRLAPDLAEPWVAKPRE